MKAKEAQKASLLRHFFPFINSNPPPKATGTRDSFTSALIADLQNSDFASHFWERFVDDLAPDALFVFTASNAKQAKEALKAALNSCFKCYSCYNRARRAFVNKYTTLFGQEDMDIFVDRLRRWSASKHLAALITDSISEAIVRELVAYPDVLMWKDLDQALVNNKQWQQHVKSLSPGVVVLAFHSNIQLRDWAVSIVKEGGSIDSEGLNTTCRELCSVMQSFATQSGYNITHSHKELAESLGTVLSVTSLSKLVFDGTQKAKTFQTVLANLLKSFIESRERAKSCLPGLQHVLVDMLASPNESLVGEATAFLTYATDKTTLVESLSMINVGTLANLTAALTSIALQPKYLQKVMLVYSLLVGAITAAPQDNMWRYMWGLGDELLKTVYFSSKHMGGSWESNAEKTAILTLFANLESVNSKTDVPVMDLSESVQVALGFVKSRQLMIQQRATDLSLLLLNVCRARKCLNEEILEFVDKVLDKTSPNQKDRLNAWLKVNDTRPKAELVYKKPIVLDFDLHLESMEGGFGVARQQLSTKMNREVNSQVKSQPNTQSNNPTNESGQSQAPPNPNVNIGNTPIPHSTTSDTSFPQVPKTLPPYRPPSINGAELDAVFHNRRPLPNGFSINNSRPKSNGVKKPIIGKHSKLSQIRAEVGQTIKPGHGNMKPKGPHTTVTITSNRSPSPEEDSDGSGEKQAVKPRRTMQLIDDHQPGSRIRRVQGLDKPVKPQPLRTVEELDRIVLNFNTSKFDINQLLDELREIPITFESSAEYVNTFERMLILECWEQYQQTLAEQEDQPGEEFSCDVLAVSQVDDFTDIQFKRTGKMAPDEIVRLVSGETKTQVLGKVTERKRDKQSTLVVVRISNRTGDESLAKSLRPNSVWQCTRLFSLTTAYREYKALSRLPMYPLRGRILKPSPPEVSSASARSGLQNALHLNAPQTAAVDGALSTRQGFILVQGPPGTGKSTTLLGLVGALQRPKKILICTPSNAAADELTRRLMKGTYDTYGRFTQMNLLRVGVTDAIASDVTPVTLEAMVNNVMKDRGQSYLPEAEKVLLERQQMEQAEVIVSTLSFAGLETTFHHELKFTDVIIDEACQAVELSTLIPLRFCTRRVFLFGDPNQLPATVLSMSAKEFSYSRSLFERMMANSSPHLLSIQYRMHPEISRIPSILFYQGHLKDAPEMAEKCKAPWHHDPLLPPYRFYDCHSGREENSSNKSKFNMAEAQACVDLVKRLFISAPKEKFSGKIGIISYYSSQLSKIKTALTRAFGTDALGHVAVGTVDSYQGQERDVIILSCVRAQSRGIGFVSDAKRINVSLTRARKSLFIVGSGDTLRNDDMWKKLIDDSYERHCFASVSNITIPKTVQPNW
ncbi:hypothetical protein SmJEL517_g02792 [Synchytrium microbalum]|uniref:AAA+ ATPase domain-containing protein n=1 Tax=Synchytrium microbalum TaxID=1806994 RepID=A0A507CAL0_9FUNG|nr:uncharacterized protein SmJEL517_g02792 [Synchytrium microbalum]TPX34553.1 hypothetical protein SmJEL517_g02792 [Synchytrium microbalum]